MSESTSAPSAPSSAPAPAAPPAISAPPAEPGAQPAPKTQPALSVSDAARMLGKRRAEAAGQAAPSQALEADKPERKDGEQAQQGAERAKPSALDRAFGTAAEGQPAEAAQPAGEIEIEGQRYSAAEIREAMGKAKDYTQKTQALAERERQLQAQNEALNLILPYIQPELAKLQQLVNGIPRPDTALLDSDPQRYFRELAVFERAREEQARLFSVNQFQNQAQSQNLEQRVEEANKALAQEFPFWADPVERAQAQTEIVNWALNKGGYTRDELRNLSDARVLKTLMKASQFDKWLGQAKTTPAAPALRAPVRGQPPPEPPSERVSVAQTNFDSKPNIRTGAALLAARRQT